MDDRFPYSYSIHDPNLISHNIDDNNNNTTPFLSHPTQNYRDYYDYPTPSNQVDPAFTRLREQRRKRAELEDAAAIASASGTGIDGLLTSTASASAQPQTRSSWNPTARRSSTISTDADNFSEAASGGLVGIAASLADRNPRESGLEAMRGARDQYQAYGGQGNGSQVYGNQGYGGQNYGGQAPPYQDSAPYLPQPPPLGQPSRHSVHSQSSDPFDDPQAVFGQRANPQLGQVNPNEIMDDGDDGLEYARPARSSMLSLGSAGRGNEAAAGAGAGTAGYGLVSQSAGHLAHDSGDTGGIKEQSDWIKKQEGSRKKWKWIIGAAVVLIILGAIGGGIAAAIINKNKSPSGASGQSAAQDAAENGDLNIDSSEIQALMDNKNLHKVFPGIDYTPINTQYPDCLENPPSQNNVTRDVAVLSQLTNTIRLYGTDCNQTAMTIHAINQLKMKDTIKIWMGVWQDNNKTTNARQLSQMWDTLKKYGDSPFKGLIVANEILFREQMTVTELGDLLAEVRTNLTSMGLSLPVATSDLGDKWTTALSKKSDYVMANIHPFFGGINAKDAASWTYNFWTNSDGAYFKSDKSKNIIAETGWPSQGGTDCGTNAKKGSQCPDASVAGISQLNQFMEDWVCDALTNATQYFWFEAFDEPWKIAYNSGEENWEDHWGIIDVNRKLKDGVKIPDCGGKKVN